MPSSISRPRVVGAGVVLLGVLGLVAYDSRPSVGFEARVRIAVDGPGRAVQAGLLGANVAWVDHGDALLVEGTTTFDPAMRSRVLDLTPTSLRYPGGAQASVHHWRRGLGPADQRGSNTHFFTGQDQPTRFGIGEFLALCQAARAEPFITVNVLTGTPAEAADWLATVNRGPVPCRWWELDNEPYLREACQPTVTMTPEAYAQRADAVITALRAVDPTVRIGLPLRSDVIGGVPATAYPGYGATVLAAIRGDLDFIALHNAYLPVTLGPPPTDRDLFAAAMAGFRVVASDLDHTRALVRRHRGRDLPLAITEFGPLFTFEEGPLAAYPATFGGALVVADLLRLFTEQDDVVLAQVWSLTGNGAFGSVSNRGRIRPTYRVLQGFRDLMQGRYLRTEVSAPTMTTTAVGVVPAQTDVPLVVARGTQDGDLVRVMVLNKSWDSAATVTIDPGPRAPTDARGRLLSMGKVFGPPDTGPEPNFVPLAVVRGQDPTTLQMTLPGPSFALVEFHLSDGVRK